ncbi:roundabout 1 [Culex quinquefasciatus]|uniref:Roundabout 1 n=1 Tax=Culex quinquefasciatus TaxID=7176 RepID=B0WQ94_CULQU|nr:roundabout 1 [Culex quinquefasciatus]|eukprot:XP_001850878.1 roundabout 1 [Culex quinquefasciatus]
MESSEALLDVPGDTCCTHRQQPDRQRKSECVDEDPFCSTSRRPGWFPPQSSPTGRTSTEELVLCRRFEMHHSTTTTTSEEHRERGQPLTTIENSRISNILYKISSIQPPIQVTSSFDSSPPPLLQVVPANQTLPRGSVAMLPCRGSGPFSPKIYWKKNGTDITALGARFSIVQGGTLKIDGVVLKGPRRRVITSLLRASVFTCEANRAERAPQV